MSPALHGVAVPALGTADSAKAAPQFFAGPYSVFEDPQPNGDWVQVFSLPPDGFPQGENLQGRCQTSWILPSFSPSPCQTMNLAQSTSPSLDSLTRLLCQSRAWTEPAPSLVFVRKPKTWGIWGCLFQTFQTVPVTSSGEQTPANGSSLTEKSHYPLFSFNPLGNSFLLKKTPQLWFVCHTPWLKNSFIVHWEFLLSGNISSIKDHLEFSLGHSTTSKINSWKKVMKPMEKNQQQPPWTLRNLNYSENNNKKNLSPTAAALLNRDVTKYSESDVKLAWKQNQVIFLSLPSPIFLCAVSLSTFCTCVPTQRGYGRGGCRHQSVTAKSLLSYSGWVKAASEAPLDSITSFFPFSLRHCTVILI